MSNQNQYRERAAEACGCVACQAKARGDDLSNLRLVNNNCRADTIATFAEQVAAESAPDEDAKDAEIQAWRERAERAEAANELAQNETRFLRGELDRARFIDGQRTEEVKTLRAALTAAEKRGAAQAREEAEDKLRWFATAMLEKADRLTPGNVAHGAAQIKGIARDFLSKLSTPTPKPDTKEGGE